MGKQIFSCYRCLHKCGALWWRESSLKPFKNENESRDETMRNPAEPQGRVVLSCNLLSSAKSHSTSENTFSDYFRSQNIFTLIAFHLTSVCCYTTFSLRFKWREKKAKKEKTKMRRKWWENENALKAHPLRHPRITCPKPAEGKS